MKKLIGFLTILTIVVMLSACAKKNTRGNVILGDAKYSENQLETLIEIINQQDRKTLQKMFSKNAKREAKNLDEGLDFLFEFVDGEIIKSEPIVDGATSEEVNYGEKTKWMRSWYYVYTEKEKYLIFFLECITDTKEPDNEGMYMLQLITEDMVDTQFDGGGSGTRCAGIYIPTE